MEDKELLIIRYFEGDLDHDEVESLFQMKDEDLVLGQMFAQYKKIYHDMDGIDITIDKPDSKSRFDDFIEQEISSSNAASEKGRVINITSVIRYAAAACVLGIVMMMGYHFHQKNKDIEASLKLVHQDMEQMLQDESPSARIKAITVNYMYNDNHVDDAMLEMLIDVLNYDPSSNVRLAAVETLAVYIDRPEVRSALIKALPTEEDAGVKIGIIQTIAVQKDDKAKDVLKSIVESDTHEHFIKDEANMQLSNLEKI